VVKDKDDTSKDLKLDYRFTDRAGRRVYDVFRDDKLFVGEIRLMVGLKVEYPEVWMAIKVKDEDEDVSP
jgi:hypothetical protein